MRFISRYYGEGETIEPTAPRKDDEVAAFIARIERSDKAFQRQLARRKVKAIQDFYAEAVNQPPIPGAVLLFTPETLHFESIGSFDNVGNLEEPRQPYLIIDGQHRLAALHFYREKYPDEAKGIHVPCMIFDGKTEDFATEMFVTINSTPTRINKSHLVDLYEKVAYAAPDKKLAAKACELLYARVRQPAAVQGQPPRRPLAAARSGSCRPSCSTRSTAGCASSRAACKVKQLNARARHRARRAPRALRAAARLPRTPRARRLVELLGQRALHGDARRHPEGPGTRLRRPVPRRPAMPDERDAALDRQAAQPARSIEPDFRVEGFYERFPAKGQVERVARIHRRIDQVLGITPIGPNRDEGD